MNRNFFQTCNITIKDLKEEAESKKKSIVLLYFLNAFKNFSFLKNLVTDYRNNVCPFYICIYAWDNVYKHVEGKVLRQFYSSTQHHVVSTTTYSSNVVPPCPCLK